MKKIIIFIFLIFTKILFAPMPDPIEQQVEQRYATLTANEKRFMIEANKTFCEEWPEFIQSCENKFEGEIRSVISSTSYETLKAEFNLIKNKVRPLLSSLNLYQQAYHEIDNDQNAESVQRACKDILRKEHFRLSFEVAFSALHNWKEACLFMHFLENQRR